QGGFAVQGSPPRMRVVRDDQHAAHTSGGRCPMANVVKKHSISAELAQKMLAKAVAKARELGVSENVAILDDGGNLKAFSRMDGAPILSIEIAQNKAYTALFGVSTQEFFKDRKSTRLNSSHQIISYAV